MLYVLFKYEYMLCKLFMYVMYVMYVMLLFGAVSYWLATCTWKSGVLGSSPAVSYVQR